jgi:hypothetical protein
MAYRFVAIIANWYYLRGTFKVSNQNNKSNFSTLLM